MSRIRRTLLLHIPALHTYGPTQGLCKTSHVLHPIKRTLNYLSFQEPAVLRIRDILVRIRIRVCKTARNNCYLLQYAFSL
jgi:hypothetical protein